MHNNIGNKLSEHNLGSWGGIYQVCGVNAQPIYTITIYINIHNNLQLQYTILGCCWGKRKSVVGYLLLGQMFLQINWLWLEDCCWSSAWSSLENFTTQYPWSSPSSAPPSSSPPFANCRLFSSFSEIIANCAANGQRRVSRARSELVMSRFCLLWPPFLNNNLFVFPCIWFCVCICI